jgi:hypothetical protein
VEYENAAFNANFSGHDGKVVWPITNNSYSL